MKQRFVVALTTLLVQAAALCVLAGLIVGVVGYGRQWKTALEYANGLFVVGTMAIVGGLFTRLDFVNRSLALGRNPRMGGPPDTEVEIRYPWQTVILGVLSGTLLIAIAMWVSRLS